MSRDTTLDWTQRIGIDLIQAAKNELEFLEEVALYPNLCSGPFVTDAIKRYEHLWLPLASKHSLRAAPLDIAWVWHAHMLSPDHYQQDCINILGKVLDHSPLDTVNRYELEKTDRIWRQVYYPSPRGCHIDLTEPHEGPTLYTAQKSQIQYNLEEACCRQFKFYYQVSLPHYKDDLFLKKAVEHYEHHLRLSRYHPDTFMVPSYDINLIWHAHLLHPLNYMQTTTELRAKPLWPHDDFKTGQAPPSQLYEHEEKPLDMWKAEGLCFARPGAMYRGKPPDPIPLRPKWLYAPLAVAEYPCEIKSIEALHLKEKNYIVRLEDAQGKAYFSQSFRGDRKTGHPRINIRYFRFEVTKHTMNVCLYKKKLFGKKFITKEELDLHPYFVIPFVEVELWTSKNPVQFCQRVTVDVPLKRGQNTVKVTILIGYPTLIRYSFKVQPKKVFAAYHPSTILSSPLLMLSPSDLANPFVPCDAFTHPVLDWKGNQVFRCRVVHSSAVLLSAVEIINAYDQVVATAHTVSPGTLPERDDVDDHRNCVFFNQAEGERAMLIRGRKDWAVCIGNWQKASQATDRRESKPQHFVRIKVYKLFRNRGWCLVRKSSGGLFVIKVDSDTVVRIDLKENKIEISPRAQDIPEVLALALSVSILHLLCIPYNPEPSQESTPAAQTSYTGPISSSFYSAGYLSVKVPTNVFLAERKDGSVTAEAVSKWGCYDFNQDSSCDWNQGSEAACTDTGYGRERVGLDIVRSAGDGGGMGGEEGTAWVPLRPRCS